MKKYRDKYPNSFNIQPIDDFANTLSVLFGSNYLDADGGEYVDLVNCAQRISKAVIYCPLSVAEWIIDDNPEQKERLQKIAPLHIRAVSHPTKSRKLNVLSMLSGTKISGADLKTFDERVTLFDKLSAKRMRSLMISTSKGIADSFKAKPVECVSVDCGINAVNRTLQAVKKNEYDFIFVIDGDFDTDIKASLPCSKSATESFNDTIARFELLSDAIDVYCKGDVLVGYVTDKGCSASFAHSKTGTLCPADANVSHFFAIKNL